MTCLRSAMKPSTRFMFTLPQANLTCWGAAIQGQKRALQKGSFHHIDSEISGSGPFRRDTFSPQKLLFLSQQASRFFNCDFGILPPIYCTTLHAKLSRCSVECQMYFFWAFSFGGTFANALLHFTERPAPR